MRNQLWWIVAIFIVTTFTATGLLALAQPYSGIDPAVFELTRLAPAIGALLTWLPMRTVLPMLLPGPVPVRQWRAHTILGVAAAVVFAAVLVGVTLAQGHPFGAALALGAPFLGLVVLQAVGAFAEELGWRGILQPVLEQRMGRLAASALVGLVWGLWHVQAFAKPLVGLVFLVAIVALSILLGHLAGGSWRQRVVTAGIVHWLVNVATLLAGGGVATIEGVTAFAIASVVTTAIFMVLFVVATRRRARRAAAAQSGA